MTRKHFNAIAAALKEAREAMNAAAPKTAASRAMAEAYDTLVISLADVCESTNDNFNRDKFFAAVYN